MSLTAAIGRIAEIESSIATLGGQRTAQASTTSRSAAPAGAGAQDFATALAQMTGVATGTATTTSPSRATSEGPLTAATQLGPAKAATASATPPRTEPTSSGAASTSSSAGQRIVETAKKYLGVPYVWGGESLSEGGLDCSGLVQLTFAEHGVSMPRVARQQMNKGTEVASLSQAVPGDLIVTRGGAHIGIYVGDGQMIHSPRPGRTVEIRDLSASEITTIRRIVPADGA